MECLFCATKKRDMITIFGGSGRAVEAAEIISKHFWFQLDHTEKPSKVVCKQCWKKINNFHQFYCEVEMHYKDSELQVPEMLETIIKTEATDGQSIEFVPFQTSDTQIKNEADVEVECQLALQIEETNNQEVAPPPNKRAKLDDGAQPNATTTEQNYNLVPSYFKMECDQCPTKFSSWKDANSHYEKEHGIKGYLTCSVCQQKVKAMNMIMDHIAVHQNPDAFKNQATTSTDANTTSQEDKSKTLQSFVQWVVLDCLPYTVANGPGFQQLAKHLIGIGAKYGENVDIANLNPSPETIAENVNALRLQKKYDTEIEELTYAFSSTISLWNYLNTNQTCFALTINYIKKSKLISKTIALRLWIDDVDNVENVRDWMDSSLKKIGCNDYVTETILVTDHTSEIMKQVSQNFTLGHLKCVSHMLDAVLTKAIQSCSQLQDMLKKFRIMQEDSETILRYDAITKSTNTYILLEWILKNYSNLFDQDAPMKLTQLFDFVGKFKEISTLLETPSQATLHYVLPSISAMRSACQENDADGWLIAKFKKAIAEGIESDIVPNIDMLHRVALFLFPPAKHLAGFSDQEKIDTHNWIEEQLRQFVPSVAQDDVENNSNNLPSTLSLSSRIFETFCSSTSDPALDLIKAELSLYLHTKPISVEGANVLEFWDSAEHEFPLLFKLSRKVLSVSATCCASKILVGNAHYLANNFQTDSLMEKTDDLLVLHLNANDTNFNLYGYTDYVELLERLHLLYESLINDEED